MLREEAPDAKDQDEIGVGVGVGVGVGKSYAASGRIGQIDRILLIDMGFPPAAQELLP